MVRLDYVEVGSLWIVFAGLAQGYCVVFYLYDLDLFFIQISFKDDWSMLLVFIWIGFFLIIYIYICKLEKVLVKFIFNFVFVV